MSMTESPRNPGLVRRVMTSVASRTFKPAARYPADPRAVFILLLSVFSGLTALALSAAPDTLERALPEWAVTTWSIVLLTGSATTLIGMMFQTVSGIITEQIGSVAVGATTIMYGILALNYAGINALQSIGVIIAWGIACLVRWGQLQVLLVQTHHAVVRHRVEEVVLERIREAVEEERDS